MFSDRCLGSRGQKNQKSCHQRHDEPALVQATREKEGTNERHPMYEQCFY